MSSNVSPPSPNVSPPNDFSPNVNPTLPTTNPSQSVQAPPPSFTADQVEKFEKRIANGYDVFIDDDFVSWLKFYHPHYLLSDLSVTENASPQLFSSENKEGTPVVVPTSEISQPPTTPISQTLASVRKVLNDVSEFLLLLLA